MLYFLWQTGVNGGKQGKNFLDACITMSSKFKFKKKEDIKNVEKHVKL